MQTAPQLFARIVPSETDTNRCFFCGGLCGDKTPADKFVKSSFTGLDTVTRSPWVCDGCIESQDESAEIALPGGELREGQKVRGYSWVIDQECRIAATKAHRQWLLQWCIEPPDPPFVICITDSGQKHLLYRAVVNHSREPVTVTLEGEPITYSRLELIARWQLCRRICAATGKPALSEPMSAQTQMRVFEHYGSYEFLNEWLAVASKPVTRLAAWLCPPRDECFIEFPPVN
jgi:hypothetical protein